MSQLTAARIFNAIVGLFSSLDATDTELLKNTMWRQKVGVHVTDGGTAGTAQTATAFFTNDTGTTLRVSKVGLKVPVAVTASDSNNAVFTVSKVDATGSNAATIATLTTNSAQGNLAAFAEYELAITASNQDLPDGWTLRVAVAKGSSGVAIAAATSQAYVETTLEPVGS